MLMGKYLRSAYPLNLSEIPRALYFVQLYFCSPYLLSLCCFNQCVSLCVLQCGRYNYGSVTGALRSVCQTEGPAALYSGLMATLLRDVPFSAIYVMFYSQTKALLPEGEMSFTGKTSNGRIRSTWPTFINFFYFCNDADFISLRTFISYEP